MLALLATSPHPPGTQVRTRRAARLPHAAIYSRPPAQLLQCAQCGSGPDGLSKSSCNQSAHGLDARLDRMPTPKWTASDAAPSDVTKHAYIWRGITIIESGAAHDPSHRLPRSALRALNTGRAVQNHVLGGVDLQGLQPQRQAAGLIKVGWYLPRLARGRSGTARGLSLPYRSYQCTHPLRPVIRGPPHSQQGCP